MQPMPDAWTPSKRKSGRWRLNWRACRIRFGRLGGRTGLNVPNSDGPPGFGSVTVAPEAQQDEIDRVLTSPRGGGPPPRVAVSPPPGNQGEPEVQPQQLYEQAYGYLLQKDYGAAESGFEDFLKRHPNHQLAGNAQYWLGETFYVRGQYQGCRGGLPEGLSNLLPKSEGARMPAEAGHVAVTSGPEGCRLFLL